MQYVVAPLWNPPQVVGGGAPHRPDETYTDREYAEVIAQEAARRHPGTNYGVFELRTVFEVRLPVAPPVLRKVVNDAGEIVPGEIIQ